MADHPHIYDIRLQSGHYADLVFMPRWRP